MGYLFLFCALIVAIFIAIFVPRAGVLIGIGLFFLGLLPMAWMLLFGLVANVQTSESDGMLMTLALFYLSAPGVMLGVLSTGAILMGWDR
jgi:hypothetical protein